MKNKFDYFNSISVDKLKKKAELSIECEGLWREAKEKSNFNIVKNSFVKLVKLIKEESEILSQIKEKKNTIVYFLNMIDLLIQNNYLKFLIELRNS